MHSYRQLSGDLRYRKHFLLRTSRLCQSVSWCQPHWSDTNTILVRFVAIQREVFGLCEQRSRLRSIFGRTVGSLLPLHGKQLGSDHHHHIHQHQQRRATSFEANLYHHSISRKGLDTALPPQGVFKSHIREDDRVYYLVGPLESLAPRSTGKCLWMIFSDEEVKRPLLSMLMDMDEATGRVFLWEWRGGARTEIFVGDLV